jgi:DNA repair protein RecO (recombination protein O)
MPTYKLNGIILKRTNLGEADRIITAFSDTGGKIKFVAKGARRTKSKLAGSIEPYCLTEMLLSSGKSLDILTSAQVKNNYLGLDPSLEQVKTAGVFAEIIDKIIPEEIPSQTIFQLLIDVLSQIKTADLNLLKAYFEAKFLNLSGLMPETFNCIKCEKRPGEKVYFTFEGGGILCTECKNFAPDSFLISQNAVKAIRFTIDNGLSRFLKLNLSNNEVNEISMVLSRFTKHSFGRDFKSERI